MSIIWMYLYRRKEDWGVNGVNLNGWFFRWMRWIIVWILLVLFDKWSDRDGMGGWIGFLVWIVWRNWGIFIFESVCRLTSYKQNPKSKRMF